MSMMKTLDSSILSFIILGIIYINVHSRSDKASSQQRLFLSLIGLNMILIIIDILSWAFNGTPGIISRLFNTVFNFLLYLIEPLAPILWILYIDFQVYHDIKRLKKLECPLAILFSANAIPSIITLYTGWFFYVSPHNIYLRGTYYWIHIAFCFSLLVYSTIFVIYKRRYLDQSHYYALLFFAVPPVLGSLIQALFLGISLGWSGMTISLLIVYVYIQNRSLSIDYLTGVYNRRQLDNYMKKKIRKSSPHKSFSVIIIDLNDFKKINDTFGHDAGDIALRTTVNIIKSCLSKDDFIARYGGDEFYIILDLDEISMLQATVNRIDQAILKFNSESHLPYKISISMGYDIYHYGMHINSDDFLKHVDMLMYKNKIALKKE